MKKYADRTIPAFNRLWYNYRRAAALRGLIFEITEIEFRMLTSLPCHYCHKEPSFVISDNKKGDYSRYVYNGIDRKDNNKGYISGNVLPCCINCNTAKGILSYNKFIEWIRKIIINVDRLKRCEYFGIK